MNEISKRRFPLLDAILLAVIEKDGEVTDSSKFQVPADPRSEAMFLRRRNSFV